MAAEGKRRTSRWCMNRKGRKMAKEGKEGNSIVIIISEQTNKASIFRLFREFLDGSF
jgi:hypothetical protein